MEVYHLLFLLLAYVEVSSGQSCSSDRQCHPQLCCLWGMCFDRKMVSSICPLFPAGRPLQTCISKANCQYHECCQASVPGSPTGVCVHEALESEKCPILSSGNGVVTMCNCELGFVCQQSTLPTLSTPFEGVCHNAVTRACTSHADCPHRKCCKRFGLTTTCVTPTGAYQQSCPTIW